MKNKILVYIFVIYISLFSIINIIVKDKEISTTERRTLQKFPDFKFDSEWISKLDKYFLDQFIFRDEFRSIKAFYNYNVLNNYDNNGIYLKDDYIFKSNYPTNRDSINNIIDNINEMSNLFNDSDIYMMIIPDKNYYLNSTNFLQIDYDYIYKEFSKLNLKFIDIRDKLNLFDYYETDTHWKQENLDKIVNEMSKIMKFKYENIKYDKNIYDSFYGVYYGESAIYRKPEKLTYLTNSLFDEVKVNYLENPNLNKVYNINNLDSFDSYNVFLDGASSFIEIFNDYAKTDKELIIFRDSFGSSITPLLVNYYKKITLIDNRYINSNLFKDKINLKNIDVLFMYSTLLINNSYSLKG